MRFDIDNIDMESVAKYMKDYVTKIEANYKKVMSQEYINWLYDYVSYNKQADNESALYVYDGVDAENGNLLGYFLNYVKDLATQQRVVVWCDDKISFNNEQVVVRIKDKYFDVFRMHGQGSWTSIKLMDKEPDYAYVKLMA